MTKLYIFYFSLVVIAIFQQSFLKKKSFIFTFFIEYKFYFMHALVYEFIFINYVINIFSDKYVFQSMSVKYGKITLNRKKENLKKERGKKNSTCIMYSITIRGVVNKVIIILKSCINKLDG